MSQRFDLPTSLTGATLSRSGEGVTLNNSSPGPMTSTPQTGGISMATLFGNPALSVVSPLPTPSPMASSTPNLLASNPLASLLAPQMATPKITATAPVIFTPPLTFSQQPLPTLGQQPSQPLVNQSTSPRGGATSGKRNVKSGRRQNSEITAPSPIEMDIATVEPPKKGWGYIFSPLNIIFLILVFIIVFITLYSSKLNMVTNLENGERVLNNKKLILWSVIVTIVIAIVGFITMSCVAKRRR